MIPAVLIAATLAAITLAVVRLFTGYRGTGEPCRILNRREQELVAAAADAFFPPGGPIPVSGSEAGAVRYFDAYVKRSSRRQIFLMRLLFLFTELGPLVFGPKRARFTRLAHAEQLRFLDEAFKSRIYLRRLSFVSLRAIMTMAYLANERVARSMRMVADADPFGAEPVTTAATA